MTVVRPAESSGSAVPPGPPFVGLPDEARLRSAATGPFVAIDWGKVTVGVAASDAMGIVATPVGAFPPLSADPRGLWAKLFAERRPAVIVVGLPVRPDGGVHERDGVVRAFAAELARRFGRPVWLWDERRTSLEAQMHLATLGIRGRKVKPLEDAQAAAALLRGVLERLRYLRETPPPPPSTSSSLPPSAGAG